MRLIDADALYQEMIKLQCTKKGRYLDIDNVRIIIANAPTINIPIEKEEGASCQ